MFDFIKTKAFDRFHFISKKLHNLKNSVLQVISGENKRKTRVFSFRHATFSPFKAYNLNSVRYKIQYLIASVKFEKRKIGGKSFTTFILL